MDDELMKEFYEKIKSNIEKILKEEGAVTTETEGAFHETYGKKPENLIPMDRRPKRRRKRDGSCENEKQ